MQINYFSTPFTVLGIVRTRVLLCRTFFGPSSISQGRTVASRFLQLSRAILLAALFVLSLDSTTPSIATFFTALATACVLILRSGRGARALHRGRQPTASAREFPLLVLFLHLGGLAALYGDTLIDLLLALERVALASYVLAAFERHHRASVSAGIQYFLVGSLPSARLLLGCALLYGQSGSLFRPDFELLAVSSVNAQVSLPRDGSIFLPNGGVTLDAVSEALTESSTVFNVPTIPSRDGRRIRALLLRRSNLLFKLTAAPFHV